MSDTLRESIIHGLRSKGWPRIDAENEADDRIAAMQADAAPVADRVSTSSPVDDRGSGNTSGKMRDAVDVYLDAGAAYWGTDTSETDREGLKLAAAVIEADRAALVAAIVADLRHETRTYKGSEYSGFAAMIAEDISAKWGGK